jgi:hypothetical protein
MLPLCLSTSFLTNAFQIQTFVTEKLTRYNGHMLKRLLVTSLMAFLPFAALADDTIPTDPTPVPTQSPSASALQPNAAASGLGPSTTSGGSLTDGGSLQPAGGSPLQSTTNDSTGLAAPATNTLQAPATGTDTLRVLAGEAEGATFDPNDTSGSHWGWLWWSLAFAALVTAGSVVFRRRALPTTPPATQTETAAAESPEPESSEPQPADPEPEPEPVAPPKPSKKARKRSRKH